MSVTDNEDRRRSLRRVQPPERDVDTASRADYLHITSNVAAYWSTDDPERLQRIRILHHPMFFEELGSTAFVVRRENTVAAYLLGFFSQTEIPVAYVHLVATHERFRRQGLAAKLYQHFIETAVLHGCESVKAITSLTNAGSIAFHQSLGMEPRGEAVSDEGIAYVPDHAGPGEHRVVMVKMLSPVLCF